MIVELTVFMCLMDYHMFVRLLWLVARVTLGSIPPICSKICSTIWPKIWPKVCQKNLSKVLEFTEVFCQCLQVTVPLVSLRAMLAQQQPAKKVKFVNSKAKFSLMLSEQFRALVCVPGAPNCSLLRPLKQTVPYSTMGYENNTTATIFITDQS